MYKLAVIGVLAVLTALTHGAVADAAEIKVLSTTALAAVMEELAPQFERESGHKVALTFATAASLSKRIAEGDAEIGVWMIPEFMAVSGVDVIGPLPADLQNGMLIAAGILVNSKESETGKALIRFLTTPASVSVIKAKGLEPN